MDLLISILLLWLIAKYVPYGDKIVAVIVIIWLLRWLGILPLIVI